MKLSQFTYSVLDLLIKTPVIKQISCLFIILAAAINSDQKFKVSAYRLYERVFTSSEFVHDYSWQSLFDEKRLS